MEAEEQQAAEPEETLHEGPALEELMREEEPTAADEATSEAEAEPEPDWRADADEALRQQ